MDIGYKLNKVQDVLSYKHEEKRKIVKNLMFGRESAELPTELKVECFMDNEAVKTFLREK